MAINFTWTAAGREFENCYAKITHFECGESNTVLVKVSIWLTAQERKNDAPPFYVHEVNQPISDTMGIRPYLYSKLHEDGYFKDAVDA